MLRQRGSRTSSERAGTKILGGGGGKKEKETEKNEKEGSETEERRQGSMARCIIYKRINRRTRKLETNTSINP
jgi:hypothetical protein